MFELRAMIVRALGLILLLASFAADAQQLALRMTRIGYPAESPRPTDEVFRQAMHERGYIEGQNFTVLYRWGEGGNYAALAEDLVRSNVDLIVPGRSGWQSRDQYCCRRISS